MHHNLLNKKFTDGDRRRYRHKEADNNVELAADNAELAANKGNNTIEQG